MISYEAFRAEFKTLAEAFDKACQMAEVAWQVGDAQGRKDFTNYASRILAEARAQGIRVA